MFRLPCRASRKGGSRGLPRTSRIARCRQGGAMGRRKPPPPAPSSLPPMAPLRRLVPLVDPRGADPEAEQAPRAPSRCAAARRNGRGRRHQPALGMVAARAFGGVAPVVGLPFDCRSRIWLRLGLTRVEWKGSLLQLGQCFGPAGERLDVHGVVGVEADVICGSGKRNIQEFPDEMRRSPSTSLPSPAHRHARRERPSRPLPRGEVLY